MIRSLLTVLSEHPWLAKAALGYAAFTTLAILFLAFHAYRSRPGYEDETGFHEGDKE